MASQRKGQGQGAGGGPKSAEGKKNSSKNATTHGVLSKKLILPGESQEQFDEVWNGWWEEYEPEGYAEERLVTLLIHNDWFLQRAMRALAQAEAALFGQEDLEPADWTEAQRSHLQVMQRYKTTAERAFYRSLAAVQGLRRDRVYMLKESTRQERRIRELEREKEELKKGATKLEAEPLGDRSPLRTASAPARSAAPCHRPLAGKEPLPKNAGYRPFGGTG